jgi:hypothetical protein
MTETTPTQAPAPTDPTAEETTPRVPPTAPPETLTTRRPSWRKDRLPAPNLDAATADGTDAGPGSTGASEGPSTSSSSRTGASRGSSRASARELRKAITVAVGGAAELGHEFLVHDPYHKAVGLLLTEEEDQDGIAEPAANMLGRRMKDAPVHPDVADGIALAIAVGAYLLKQLGRWRYARELRGGNAVLGDGLQLDLSHDQGPPADEQAPDPAPAPAPAPVA